MTEKPNFFKLGVFILLASGLIVAGLIIFGSGTFGKEKVFFETYFSESVLGLTEGSLIFLEGVKIGVVEKVTFVQRSYKLPVDDTGISEYDQHIHVICSALKEELPTPQSQASDLSNRLSIYVQRGFRLRLGSNIITGQSYLEALYLDPVKFPVMEIAWEPQYIYIPSAPSTFSTIQDSVTQIVDSIEEIKFKAISESLNKVLETLNQAISDIQIKALSGKVQDLVSNVDQSVTDADIKTLSSQLQQLMNKVDQAVTDAQIKAMSDKVQNLISNADQAVSDADVKQLSTKATALIEELRQSNQDFKKLIENPDENKKLSNIPVLIDKLSQAISGIDQLITVETPQVHDIIQNIKQLSENLDYLIENLQDNPSQLIFSSPPPKKEK